MKRTACLTLIALVGSFSGCANEGSVEGKVVFEGKPVDSATVAFHNEDGTVVGSAETDGLGVFKLRSSQGKNKIPNGTYKVVVVKTDAPPPSGSIDASDPNIGKMMMKAAKAAKSAKSLIPQKYASIKTTTLTAKVPSDGPIELKLDP